jgi:hypothetical protein
MRTGAISTEQLMRGFVVGFALLVAAVPAGAGGCTAHSGQRTAALVELYTSEGCSSCPPADRWLSTLASRFSADRVVPLALHVDYWDYLGWRDPYAQRKFSERQRKLSLLQRMALIYTPQVLLQGRDFRAWNSPALDAAVERINAQPPRARLAIDILSAGSAGLRTAVRGEVLDQAQRADAALYIAAFQHRLQSDVGAGENGGRRLTHDYVVLEWQGPIASRAEGGFAEERTLALLPTASAETSGVAAFVQNRRTAEVLQALLLAACSP